MDDPLHIPPTASERRHCALTNPACGQVQGRGWGRGQGRGQGDDIVLEEAPQILQKDVIDNGSGDDDSSADVDQADDEDTSSDGQNDQLNWLMRTLEVSNASWHIIAGFHSMEACDENIEQMETKEAVEALYRISLKYGVNAYLSGQPCANSFHTDDGISNRGLVTKGPYFTTMHQRPVFFYKTVNGFLLHRVSSLEIVNYIVSLSWGRIVTVQNINKLY
ncbi:hypothetical protein LOK49_LG06G02162 [Camellia lanceoleosa]|uniref:Uncharacterized protein n=1 Tax=Camellia lanceoleosa TaxID=1840588 RepID=A0ACC0HDB8_9ERIC|nr:hypothetical protein LOK49_LG06G02162 [Camellia lanceoleosa]